MDHNIPTPLEMKVLAILAKHDCSSRDMLEQCQNGGAKVRDNTFFPALTRMRTAGLIEPVGDETTGENGSALHHHHITRIGRRALERGTLFYSALVNFINDPDSPPKSRGRTFL
jgi:DNA-binding PadR family transcriptional regulator